MAFGDKCVKINGFVKTCFWNSGTGDFWNVIRALIASVFYIVVRCYLQIKIPHLICGRISNNYIPLRSN